MQKLNRNLYLIAMLTTLLSSKFLYHYSACQNAVFLLLQMGKLNIFSVQTSWVLQHQK